jgi:peroxiredoxin
MKWRGLQTVDASQSAATLKQELEERKVLAEQYVPAETQAINRSTVDELNRSGIREGVLGIGAKAPSFELADQDGKLISSKALLSQGNLVICFFRGRWCPFCVAQMEAMNQILPQLQQSGAGLVGISPQTVRQCSFMHDQHHLGFPLLSDKANAVARQFGLVYRVPESQQEVYRKTFVNLPFLNGEASWELPIPATYVLQQDSTISYVQADPDYARRPEPAEILEHTVG